MSLNVGSVVATLGARIDDDAIDRYERRLNTLDRRPPIETNVRVDSTLATRELDRYGRRLGEVDAVTVDTNVDADTRRATVALDRYATTVEEADAARVDTNVDVDARHARTELADYGATVEALDAKRVDTNVDADTRRAEAGMARYAAKVEEADAANSGLVKGTGRLRGAMGTLFIGGAGVAGAGIALGLLAVGAKTTVSAFEESEIVGRRQALVIRTMGQDAGATAEHVNELAAAMERKTGIDDDTIISGANIVRTFKNIRNEAGAGNDIFDRTTRAAVDLSKAFGTDLQSASIQLGKALDDPARGAAALSRTGAIAKADVEALKKAAEAGTPKLELQRRVLHAVEKQIKGTAEETATGSDKMLASFGELEEFVGGKIAPAFNKGAGFIRKFIDGIREGKGAGGAFRDGVGRAVEAVKPVVSTVVGVVKTGARIVGDFIRQAGGAGRIIERIGGILRNAANTVGDFAHTLAPVASAIGRVAAGVVRFGLAFGSSKAGLIAMHGALGAIIGRLVGLAAAWAVGKAAAFAGVIARVAGGLVGLARAQGIARGATILLSRAFTASGFGAILTIVGALAGAFGLFGGSQKRAATSARDLSTALDQEADALRGVRDLDLDAAAAKANLLQANVGVQEAERNLNRIRKAGKGNTLEAKQAEADLAAAHVNQKRAARDAGDVEADAGRKIKEARRATADAIKTTKDRIQTLGEERIKLLGQQNIQGKTSASTKRLADIQRELNQRQRELPNLEGRLRKLDSGARNAGGGMGAARSATDLLNAALGRLPRSVTIRVALAGVDIVANSLNNLVHDRTAWIKTARKRLGGRVGPNAGGPRVFIAGEGDADEWVISQEGDRSSNVQWAREALEALTGRTVELHKTGKPPARVKGGASALRGGRSAAAPGALPGYEQDISNLERRYSQLDRRLNLDDETFITQNEKGEDVLDTAAIAERAGEKGKPETGEIGQLVKLRRAIRARIRAYWQAVKRAERAVRTAMTRLRAVLKRAKGKKRGAEREGYRAGLADLSSRHDELESLRQQLGGPGAKGHEGDYGDATLDIDELLHEKRTILGTTVTAAPPLDDPTATPEPEPEPEPAPEPDTPAPAEANPDVDAIIAQGAQLVANRDAEIATLRGALGAFGGAGDLGLGGADAFRAATASGSVGAGNTGAPAAAFPDAAAGMYLLRIDDPAGQRAVGDAATAGFGWQAPIPSPVEITGL